MRCVHVEVLVQRERNRVIVERRIRACPVFLNRRVREPSEELGDVPGAQGARGRRTRTVAVVEVEVETVLEPLPLGLGKETAEGGVAESDRLSKDRTNKWSISA